MYINTGTGMYTGVNLGVCVCAHVHLDVDVNIGSSKPSWFCFFLRDHLANKSLINNNATIFLNNFYIPVTAVDALRTSVIVVNVNLTATMQEKVYLLHPADGETKVLKAKLAARGLNF